MHPTQLEILDSLRLGESRKFGELLSEVAETSDNLTYHLKRLVRAGLIESTTKGEYSLAEKGLMYINNNLELNHDLFPTVSCMLELCNTKDEILVMKKLKQPFLGSKHLPTFGVTSDESLMEQISDFLKKYQIVADNLAFKCNYRERVRSGDDLFIFDKVFVVFTGTFSEFQPMVNDREFLLFGKEALAEDPDVLPASLAVLGLSSHSGFTETTRTNQ